MRSAIGVFFHTAVTPDELREVVQPFMCHTERRTACMSMPQGRALLRAAWAKGRSGTA